VNPQEKQADDGQLTDQLSISVLLRIAGSTARLSQDLRTKQSFYLHTYKQASPLIIPLH
jgi:hypothetical protein